MILTLSDFTVGERVDYVLPRTTLPSTVVKITTKRLVIQPDGEKLPRTVAPRSVRKVAP